jgi:hypothetical protein
MALLQEEKINGSLTCGYARHASHETARGISYITTLDSTDKPATGITHIAAIETPEQRTA